MDADQVRRELADLARSYVGDVGGEVYQPATTLPIAGIAFCGVAYLHWCREYGLTDLIWGPGFMLSRYLRQTSHPLQGDLVYIHRPYNHHAMFVRRDGEELTTIDANAIDRSGRQWQSRATVERTQTIASLGGADNVIYYSLQPWIDDYLEYDAPDTEPAPAPLKLPRVRAVDRISDDRWRQIQRQLAVRGLYSGRIDGDPGPLTTTAIIAAWYADTGPA